MKEARTAAAGGPVYDVPPSIAVSVVRKDLRHFLQVTLIGGKNDAVGVGVGVVVVVVVAVVVVVVVAVVVSPATKMSFRYKIDVGCSWQPRLGYGEVLDVGKETGALLKGASCTKRTQTKKIRKT